MIRYSFDNSRTDFQTLPYDRSYCSPSTVASYRGSAMSAETIRCQNHATTGKTAQVMQGQHKGVDRQVTDVADMHCRREEPTNSNHRRGTSQSTRAMLRRHGRSDFITNVVTSYVGLKQAMPESEFLGVESAAVGRWSWAVVGPVLAAEDQTQVRVRVPVGFGKVGAVLGLELQVAAAAAVELVEMKLEEEPEASPRKRIQTEGEMNLDTKINKRILR